MRTLLSFLSALFLVTGVALANEDDTAWIAKCMQDNKKEGQTTETVTKYCACMNDKMSSDETKSITEWEKLHPQEEAECEKAAGWK